MHNIMKTKRRKLYQEKKGEDRGAKEKQLKRKIEVGDRVKILTKKFGKAYAEGLPTFTFGYVRGKKGDLFDVLWDAGDAMMAHRRHLSFHDENDEQDEDEPKFNGKITKEIILPVLLVGTTLLPSKIDNESNWPRSGRQE
jgi:hypothetical protein